MDKITVKLDAQSDSQDLGLIVRLDNNIVAKAENFTKTVIEFDFDEDTADHTLEFQMIGKQTNHTEIDEQGNIVKDNLISISNLSFDGIPIDQLFVNLATYTHNFNGNTEETVEKFYGTMGCNGTVKFDFSCPFYLWLLENT